MTKFIPALAAAALFAASNVSAGLSEVPAGTYELEDTHGYISFSYLHLGFSRPVVGFDAFDVSLELNQDDVTKSALTVDVDPASVTSRVEAFDGHLKGDKFFDIANHSDIQFVATEIVVTGEDTMTVIGDLTIKGITKPLTLDATVNKAGTHPFSKKPTIGISASATLNRSEWDLGYAAPAVSDEVVLDIQTELRLVE
ncbi:MAG: YceI family protein [Woeseiaceae bacterium]